MSDAERAYEASAEALKRNMLAYAADFMDLAPHESLVEDPTHPYCVRIDPGVGQSFPIMDVSLQSWRKRGPGSTTEVMVRALGRLARARVWHRHETIAPPAGLLETNAIGKALVERAGVDPQAFVDATWTSVAMSDKYADTADWASAGEIPVLFDRAPSTTHPKRELPAGLPWMAGYSLIDGVMVEAVSLAPDVAILWRPTRADVFEIRIPAGISLTLMFGMIGQPLRRLISHPLLNRFDLIIREVRYHQRTTRFTVGGSEIWKKRDFKGGNEVRREADAELSALRPARRKLEDLISRMLTLPGVRGDAAVSWSELDLGDDPFMSGDDEQPEFLGIMARRTEEESRLTKGGLIMQFDDDHQPSQDDPTAPEGPNVEH